LSKFTRYCDDDRLPEALTISATFQKIQRIHGVEVGKSSNVEIKM